MLERERHMFNLDPVPKRFEQLQLFPASGNQFSVNLSRLKNQYVI